MSVVKYHESHSVAVLDMYAADEVLVDKPVSQACAQRTTLLGRQAKVFGKQRIEQKELMLVKRNSKHRTLLPNYPPPQGFALGARSSL